MQMYEYTVCILKVTMAHGNRNASFQGTLGLLLEDGRQAEVADTTLETFYQNYKEDFHLLFIK